MECVFGGVSLGAMLYRDFSSPQIVVLKGIDVGVVMEGH